MDRKRRKANGTCKGCQEPAIPGQLRCTICAEQHRQKDLTYRERLKGSPKDYELRENRNRKGAEVRKRHKKLGRCVRLPESIHSRRNSLHHLSQETFGMEPRLSTQPQSPGPLPLTEERTVELTKPKPRKTTNPNLRKPKTRKPRVPTKTAEERIESRREYEQTRSQTAERKELQRLKAQRVRQERKASGLCRDCSNQAMTGQIPVRGMPRQTQGEQITIR